LGRIKAYYDWDWAGAEAEFKRAIELNPNSSDAHREYAGYLTAVLRTEEAITEAKRARDIDPLSQLNNYHVAWALISARRYDEAIQQSEQVLRTFPQAHLWIGWANIGKGKYDEAIMNFEARLRALGDDPVTTANLGYAFGVAGRRNEAEKVLAELRELSEHHHVSPYLVAVVYAGLGDKNQTFAWLDKAYQVRSRMLAHGLKVNPVWDPLRTDPRFAELLRRVGLPE
jgi:tetratricopeptide (TPR) repeat protein